MRVHALLDQGQQGLFNHVSMQRQQPQVSVLPPVLYHFLADVNFYGLETLWLVLFEDGFLQVVEEEDGTEVFDAAVAHVIPLHVREQTVTILLYVYFEILHTQILTSQHLVSPAESN